MPAYIWALILVAAIVVSAAVTALIVINVQKKSAASTIGGYKDKSPNVCRHLQEHLLYLIFIVHEQAFYNS